MAIDHIPIQIESTPPEADKHKGKSYKDKDTLDLLAQKVVDQLRSYQLPIWQAKDVLKNAILLLDWETLR